MEEWALITPHAPRFVVQHWNSSCRSLAESNLWDFLLSKKIKMAREIASGLYLSQTILIQ